MEAHIRGLLAVLVACLAQVCAGAAAPPPVMVVDVRNGDARERLLAVSLEGLANRAPGEPRVFVLSNGRDEGWLDYCLRMTGQARADVTLEELRSQLRGLVKGQVLYDPGSPYTLDLATTAAGLGDLLISDVDLGLPTLFDFRGRFASADQAYAWAVANLLPGCDRTAAAMLAPGSHSMRDFAIARRMFAFSPPMPSASSFEELLFHLPAGTAIYGEGEPGAVARLSASSHFLVSAAAAANLSFLAAVEPEARRFQYPRYVEAIAPRYLTLIFDCSDLDFSLNEMPGLWDAPRRGALPLGWAVPAALAEVGGMAHRYYADAYWSGTDQFVLGASGAGQLDLAAGGAPYGFYRATREAGESLDIQASLLDASTLEPSDVSEQVVRFASETGMRGVFLTGIGDMAPALLGGVAVLAAPRVSSVEEAVTYLNRIPLERRCVALVLEADVLGPAEAAHIAARVADRYALVPPVEMVELMGRMAAAEAVGTASVLVSAVDYTERPTPEAPTAVSAAIQPAEEVASAETVYRPSGSELAFTRPMVEREGGFAAVVPPLLQGGEFAFRIRARDRDGRTAWSPIWTLQVPREDADADGLSDAEEGLLLTDAHSRDTEGDGLADGNDPAPLQPDRFSAIYAGPIYPPDDLPYLPQPGSSSADLGGRTVAPGSDCLYWLPLSVAPPAASMVVSLDADGPAAVATGTRPDQLTEQFAGELSGDWHGSQLPAEAEATGVFVRISCPAGARVPLTIRSVSVVSPPAAPSVFRVATSPAYPGPEQPINVSAVAFSPLGVERVQLGYRVNGGGAITIPMTADPLSQTYRARIPSLENRDELEYWVVAADGQGGRTATVPVMLPIGGRAREAVALLARRDFVGQWVPSADWDGAGAMAPGAEGQDTAFVQLAGGTYTVWILAGGRGQGIDVYLKGASIGSIDPMLPDGWQRIGRARFEEGRNEIRVVARAEADAPTGAAPRYAAVLVTADSALSPPINRVLDIHNSISLLAPSPTQTISGTAELLATGAGNMTGAEFSLNGETVRRVSGPPFRLSLNTRRYSPGPYTLRVEATDRSGPTGLAVEIPVTIAP
ncbi:MAG: hypothetical protein ACE149_14195 [Armatimonadota bacterium]